MRTCSSALLPVLLELLSLAPSRARGEDLRADAAAGLKRAVTFFHQTVAVEGGYVWRYSADLKLREGEGVVKPTEVWVQPPGTPAVGMAMLDAWERTRDPYLLAAAADAGRALVRGQLHSGGWNGRIDFDPAARKKQAYRVDGEAPKKARNISSFDDDKTQSAVRFLVRLDAAGKFQDAQVHGATAFALDAILAAQHANGAWSQVWDGPSKRDDDPDLRASLPDEWSREHPGGDYWWHYTFNDGTMSDTVEALLEAHDVYGDAKYLDAARRCGDFIRRAQLPEPQPAWAQQYDRNMHPAWARKFEPPAVTAGESQKLLRTLLLLHARTGDATYLERFSRAIAWLKRSTLPDGRLARFYELRTNRPLYMTRDYKLTHDDGDVPTHYSFTVASNIASIERAYERAKRQRPAEAARSKPKERAAPPTDADVRRLLAAMDARGAWVEQGRLKYHKVDGPLIDSATFIRNVGVLARYAGAGR